jgi:hypothetical protein
LFDCAVHKSADTIDIVLMWLKVCPVTQSANIVVI